MKILEEKMYDFIDSFIDEIKWDGTSLDYLLSINCFLDCYKVYKRLDEDPILTLRLHNVKKLELNVKILDKKDSYAPYELNVITKRKKGEYVELICESTMSMMPEDKDDPPLFYCLCDEVYIERTDSNIDNLILNQD